jgi:hypothetical protein
LRADARRGAVWRRVFCLCVLATLALGAGQPEGRRALESVEGAGREGFLAPEIMRLEGELRLQSGSPDSGAIEQWFVAAIDLARRRKEKSLELRAAMSLARLHHLGLGKLYRRTGKGGQAKGN